MQLDIRTLLIAVALATGFCTAARLLLWRMHPTLPGLGQWAFAGGAAVVGLLLIIVDMSGTFSMPLLLSAAQALIAAAIALAWDGFRRFVGQPPLSNRVLGLLAALTLLPIAIAHGVQSLPLRSVSYAALLAAVSALIARDLLRGTDSGAFARRVTGWIYAVNAGFFLARAVAAAVIQDPVSPWNPDGLAALPALWSLCMTVATTLGMVLMTGERLQSHLDRQASRDPLTGVLNRRAFASAAAREVGRALREGRPLSVLMVDLDHFKRVNDDLGHGAGDAVLCRFVAVAERALRGEDLICRFGGEEFVLLLPNTPAGAALAVAERLRIAFAEDATILPATLALLPAAATVSIGVGELLPGEAMESLLRRADAALYRAKAAGRNRSLLAESGMEQGEKVPRTAER